MKPAIKKLIKLDDGRVDTIFIDPETGLRIFNLDGYQVSNSDGGQPNNDSDRVVESLRSKKANNIGKLFGVSYTPNKGVVPRQPEVSTQPTSNQTRPSNVEKPVSSAAIPERTERFSPAQAAIEQNFDKPSLSRNPYDTGARTTGDLSPRQMSKLSYDLQGAKRSEIPSSDIANKVQTTVTDVLGPDYSVSLHSGMEPKGLAAVGSNRHPQGLAGDFRVIDPDGNVLRADDPRMRDVAQAAAAQFGANVGLGPEYMSTSIHIDQMKPENFSRGQSPQWGSVGKEMSDILSHSREYGLMPESFYREKTQNPPTPTPRPDTPIAGAVDIPENYLGMNTRSFTPEEKSLMAKTLAGELDLRRSDLNTNTGRLEAMGILSTIENRSPKYGGIESAITADKQYSTWNNQRAAEIANKNYAQNPELFDSIVDHYTSDPQMNLGFTSYYNPTIANPDWGPKLDNVVDLGPHKFGTLPEYTNYMTDEVNPQYNNRDNTGLSEAVSRAAGDSINRSIADNWSSSRGNEMAFSSPSLNEQIDRSSTKSINDSVNNSWQSTAGKSLASTPPSFNESRSRSLDTPNVSNTRQSFAADERAPSSSTSKESSKSQSSSKDSDKSESRF